MKEKTTESTKKLRRERAVDLPSRREKSRRKKGGKKNGSGYGGPMRKRD